MKTTGKTPTPDTFDGYPEFHKETDLTLSNEDIETTFKELKNKNCYGSDRVPLRLYKDGGKLIMKSVKSLFDKILISNTIPKIWKVSRIIPIHKKGKENQVENYRPISNLCSVSKIFEKIIKAKMEKIAILNQVDLTSIRQYGFKEKSGTDTLMLDLQDTIANGLENGKLVGVISLDLTAAFDVVVHEVLLRRLERSGLQMNMIAMIKNWFQGRSAYVECEGETSKEFDMIHGTIQGSVMGPLFFALFIKPILIREKVIAFADDNYIVEIDEKEETLLMKLEAKCNLINEWMVDSGLVVNLGKTEFVVFNKNKSLKKKLK